MLWFLVLLDGGLNVKFARVISNKGSTGSGGGLGLALLSRALLCGRQQQPWRQHTHPIHGLLTQPQEDHFYHCQQKLPGQLRLSIRIWLLHTTHS